MREVLVLYTEKQLQASYDVYRRHQALHDQPFIAHDDFRAMYEEMMAAFYKQESSD
tara:strand:- start:4671 stop:4838 length:168 start_codon:yes stop_codon:yes gene_type:complete